MRRLRRPRIDTGEVSDRWQPRLYLRLIVLGLLVAYAIAFVLENRKQVNVHFVLATASVSLVWLILLALGVGLRRRDPARAARAPPAPPLAPELREHSRRPRRSRRARRS